MCICSIICHMILVIGVATFASAVVLILLLFSLLLLLLLCSVASKVVFSFTTLPLSTVIRFIKWLKFLLDTLGEQHNSWPKPKHLLYYDGSDNVGQSRWLYKQKHIRLQRQRKTNSRERNTVKLVPPHQDFVYYTSQR